MLLVSPLLQLLHFLEASVRCHLALESCQLQLFLYLKLFVILLNAAISLLKHVDTFEIPLQKKVSNFVMSVAITGVLVQRAIVAKDLVCLQALVLFSEKLILDWTSLCCFWCFG